MRDLLEGIRFDVEYAMHHLGRARCDHLVTGEYSSLRMEYAIIDIDEAIYSLTRAKQLLTEEK